MTRPEEDTLALIDAIRAQGGEARGLCTPWDNPTPLAPALLATLKAPNGAPLPPSLAAWLAFDATWLDLFTDPATATWNTTTARAFAAEEIASFADELADEEHWNPEDAAAYMLESLDPALHDAPALRLPDSASQAHLMIFHQPDALGEYPIHGYEKEEFWIKYRDFADFLKHWFG